MTFEILASIALALSLVAFILSMKSYNVLTVFAEYIMRKNSIKDTELNGNRMETKRKTNGN